MSITDSRVQKMNEILNYIKFIKMYAWVKAFSQTVRRKCPVFASRGFLRTPILPHLLEFCLKSHGMSHAILNSSLTQMNRNAQYSPFRSFSGMRLNYKFLSLVTGIREEERLILERAGYFQSITVGVAPIVVVIASVATFSTHMLLGYDLNAAQVRL